MTTDAAPMDRIMAAVAALHAGDRADARRRFNALWEDGEVSSSPARRCVIAHYAADAQESLEQELAWDQRALAAAEEAPDAEIAAGGAILSIRMFLPSLHLNLGDAYRRSDLLALARDHAARAREASIVLPDDGYGATVRAAIERLSARLAVTT
jgi:uncharacterized membrane-anchored protein